MRKKKGKLKIKNILILVVIILFIVLCPIIFKNRDFQVELKQEVLTLGASYEDNFEATFKGSNVTNDVEVKHNIYNEKVGKYQIKFTYTKDGKTYQDVKYIEIKDNIKPEITLKKGNEVTVIINENYDEPGYKAIDNYDGDITSKVKVSGSVDITAEGVYELKYTVSDSSKNEVTVIRKVNVTSVSPLTMSVKDFTLKGLYSDVLLSETENKGKEYSDEFIFIGDSTALYYVINKQIPGTRLWHKEGLDPETALTNSIYINHIETNLTFVENFAKFKPKKAIITLGSNSVAYMEPGYFIKNYKELIRKIKEVSPDTLLIVQSIPPVAAIVDNRENSASKLNNEKINNFNYYILEMCSELDVPFLNSAEALKDGKGQLKEGYYIKDGIHLSKSGNEVIMKYFENHVYEK